MNTFLILFSLLCTDIPINLKGQIWTTNICRPNEPCPMQLIPIINADVQLNNIDSIYVTKSNNTGGFIFHNLIEDCYDLKISNVPPLISNFSLEKLCIWKDTTIYIILIQKPTPIINQNIPIKKYHNQPKNFTIQLNGRKILNKNKKYLKILTY
jgi:hypothetical protein